MNYSHNDITLVFGIRARDYNPWILERLKLVGNYYNPLPKVVIIDFGSPEEHSTAIREICEQHGFEYNFVDDPETFSPAIARNSAVKYVKTPLIFFNDIDCFWTSDFFPKLAHAANIEQMDKYWDRMLNMPVYHLTEDATENISDGFDSFEASIRMEQTAHRALASWRRQHVDFVAPYSNVFLIRKDYFEYLGGYNETFRGHGSEDFEFLIRYALISKYLPTPAHLEKDYYGPLREAYYTDLKEYKGYRRLFEVLSAPAELLGLKVLHFHHDKPAVSDWVSKNDWKRDNFTVELEKILESPWKILEQDWLPRNKKVLVLLKHKDQYEYFLPLRSAGYSIEVLLPGEQAPENVVDKIKNGYYDAISIFNPYMKSHQPIRPYYELAKKAGVTTIVVERGALPGSWYYAPEVAYNDSDYKNQVYLDWFPSDTDVDTTTTLIKKLRAGDSTLEKSSGYQETYDKHSLVSALANKVIFIPLQLHDDMAVTRYTEGHISYGEYYDSVLSICDKIDDDTIVLVKAHPLSGGELRFRNKNVIVCNQADNVHALIELSDAVICYNSGVGLLSLIHGKDTFTIGNSFYSHSTGLAEKKETLDAALQAIKDDDSPKACPDLIFKFVGWLATKKYSYFLAESVVKDFGDRKSHAYKNILPKRINIADFHINVTPSKLDRSYFKSSYLAAKYNIFHNPIKIPAQPATSQTVAKKESAPAQKVSEPNHLKALDITNSEEYKKYKLNTKLRNNPYQYFNDAKAPLARKLRFLFTQGFHGPLFRIGLKLLVRPMQKPTQVICEKQIHNPKDSQI
ncbi:glycosyltransferase [Pseudomonas atacamensis]|uniref:capsular polysaccharide export protein, LipB/KpsS family n=1 Tax=Pseudomonas atacamensis TaxID=2565368 RepID=UPI001C3DFC2C|nr:glycosyltransferase [Pseudomonas atacamensis]QXH74841.1 glycosyltransferase [Pseudomonas atacamensis]